MKQRFIDFIVVLVLFLFGCTAPSKVNDWKTAFQLKDSTGIFAGKIDMNAHWAKRVLVIHLSPMEWEKYSYSDTISMSGYFLFKNIPEGKYTIDISDQTETPENVTALPQYSPFPAYSCRMVYVNIIKDKIINIHESFPGSKKKIDEGIIIRRLLPWEKITYDKKETTARVDTCVVTSKEDSLTEASFLKVYNNKHQMNISIENK